LRFFFINFAFLYFLESFLLPSRSKLDELDEHDESSSVVGSSFTAAGISSLADAALEDAAADAALEGAAADAALEGAAADAAFDAAAGISSASAAAIEGAARRRFSSELSTHLEWAALLFAWPSVPRCPTVKVGTL
jgi:hypothetical protein